ncbi:hypothetical protein Q1695_001193 [Nippostrongylus brasiliensis]|nr:hypothetical protein Q1695_001193 [Nippostrongylus brasiliensis]
MMEALSEAIRKQLSALAILDSTTSFKALVHNSILEQYGLMQKQEEYTDDDKPEDEEADFQEELQQHKQEDNDESLRLFTEGFSVAFSVLLVLKDIRSLKHHVGNRLLNWSLPIHLANNVNH